MITTKQIVLRKGLERLLPIALLIFATGHAPPSEAGATFKIDDTKWVSIGAGLRTSFETREDSAGTPGNSQWSNDFN